MSRAQRVISTVTKGSNRLQKDEKLQKHKTEDSEERVENSPEISTEGRIPHTTRAYVSSAEIRNLSRAQRVISTITKGSHYLQKNVKLQKQKAEDSEEKVENSPEISTEGRIPHTIRAYVSSAEIRNMSRA